MINNLIEAAISAAKANNSSSVRVIHLLAALHEFTASDHGGFTPKGSGERFIQAIREIGEKQNTPLASPRFSRACAKMSDLKSLEEVADFLFSYHSDTEGSFLLLKSGVRGVEINDSKWVPNKRNVPKKVDVLTDDGSIKEMALGSDGKYHAKDLGLDEPSAPAP